MDLTFNMTQTGYTMHNDFGSIAISGDASYGFKPSELLVASIVVCSAGVLRQILNKMRIDVQEVQVNVTEVEHVEEESMRIRRIAFHFTVKASNLTEAKLKKAIDLSTKNCAMAQTVAGAVELDKTFTLIES